MQDPQLGIVIVSYNTIDLLRGCLASLQACTLFTRIVVVDNASGDGTVEMVRREFPAVELVALSQNRGFAAGNNVGISALLEGDAGPDGQEQASGRTAPPYIVLLNPDTVVQPGALERMVAFLNAHPDVGAVGPRLLNPDGTIQENAFTFPTLWMTFLDLFPLHGRIQRSRLNGRYPEIYGTDPFPIDHPLGACLMLRQEALQEVGLLDERYFMYVEEVDLCYRLQQAGWQIYHLPTARVVHYGGQSTRQVPNRMFVELHRSRQRFFRKFYSPLFLWAHRQILRLGLAWRAWQDQRAQRAGQLSPAELERRLEAYRTIIAMR